MYWLERASRLGIGGAEEIRTVDDIARFGPMDEEALRTRPVEDFIPGSCLARRTDIVVGETGGTMGRAKVTVYREDEFNAAFVAPFIRVADHRGFPAGESWLWVGPGGPHIIGKAAAACARALSSPDPFCVDCDARWAKKLSPGSVAAKRYLAHIVAQSLDLIRTQRIGVIFSTPKIFDELAAHMTEESRNAVLGLHFGGMQVQAALAGKLEEAFPNAVFIAGYGNTLFGMCPEFKGVFTGDVDYFPMGDRIVFRTVNPDSEMSREQKLAEPVDNSAPGQIVFSRLDESFMILNMFERDEGRLVRPGAEIRDYGFHAWGIRNPCPLRTERKVTDARVGLY